VIPEILEIDFNITNIRIENMSLNPGSKLMQLGDDQAVFQIEDFKGVFRF
jgi:hypothetical protein